MSQLRREAIELLDRAIAINHRFDYRKAASATAIYPQSDLTYHDNVANQKASEFYKEHGVTVIEPALETTDNAKSNKNDITVMTTRYCVRRQLGQCLKENGDKWTGPLFLTAPGIRFRLDFDCHNCRMKVIKPSATSC